MTRRGPATPLPQLGLSKGWAHPHDPPNLGASGHTHFICFTMVLLPDSPAPGKGWEDTLVLARVGQTAGLMP